jgi:hypothetical protein
MKIRKSTVILILLVVIAVFFTVYNIVWNYYIKNTFDQFLNNENLQAISDENYRVLSNRGWHTHQYRDYGGSGYMYQISMPPRLHFGGGLSIRTDDRPGSSYGLSLTIYTGLNDWVYVLGISDLSEAYTSYGSNIHVSNIHELGSSVDKTGQPLGRHPDDSEDFYNEWLALYEQFKVPISTLFDDVILFFGMDVFR